jgi:hypothetical protein
MIYIAWLIIIFTALQLSVAIVNLITRPRLRSAGLISDHPLVSVLIPVRDEEETIGVALDSIMNQDYKNIEVIVFDDESGDNTAKIVGEYSGRYPSIKLYRSLGLPEGWLGKTRACHSLSMIAGGEYLLFIDADTRISGHAITRALSYARIHSLGLLSVFPGQDIRSAGEWFTVPVMNYILLSLLPLVLVRRSSYSSVAAANGQFMFFNAARYRDLMPHAMLKNNRVEDIAMARLFKKKNIPVACLTGDAEIRCRMYDSFTSAVNGFSKNVTAFFGDSFILAFLFWIVTTVGFIPVMLSMTVGYLFVYTCMYISTRVIISFISQQNAFLNLVCIIPQQFATGMIIAKAFLNNIFKSYQWKGRHI